MPLMYYAFVVFTDETTHQARKSKQSTVSRGSKITSYSKLDRWTNPGNVHSQSIDLGVASGNESSGTAVGTVPIYTPARRYIARKTTLIRIANHLGLFIVIYPGPFGVSIRVRQDADRNEQLYSGCSRKKCRRQKKWKLLSRLFFVGFLARKINSKTLRVSYRGFSNSSLL